MRFGFVTCVQLGLSCMEAIYDLGGTLNLAITLTDEQAKNKSGRVYLDAFCDAHSIPLKKFRNINEQAAVETIQAHGIDWLFVIGWSQIARQPVLDAPARGVLGIHPTLLPEGRGRAAVPWAILKDLERTGVTMFKLDAGTDTGPIASQLEIPLPADADATWLYSRVEEAHIELIRQTFVPLQADRIEFRVQDERNASEWPGRKPEDGQIDLDGSVVDAERLVRAVTRPYPGAFVDRGNERIVVWSARRLACPDDAAPAAFVLNFRDGTLEATDYDRTKLAAGDEKAI